MTQRRKLGEMLVQAGAIDEAQLHSALGEQRKWGSPLGMTLVRMGFLEEDELIQVLASQLKLPVVKLGGKRVNPEVLARVPVELAEKHRCIPLLVNEEGGQQVLYLGMEDPADLEAVDDLSFRLGEKVKPVLVAPTELEEAIHRHYQWESYAGDAVVAKTGAEEGPPEFVEVPSSGGAGKPASRASRSSAAERSPGSHGGMPPEVILRALTQLLVEKGVITREELVDRLSSVARAEDE